MYASNRFSFGNPKKCKENGIHTAVDTAGHVPWEYFEKIIPYTDLFLYDIKSMDNKTHKEYTGVENTLILQNLAELLQLDTAVWIRIPVIPGVNDTEKEFYNIKSFLHKNGQPAKVELLPYHAMGEHKYDAVGKKTQSFDTPRSETIQKLKDIINI